MENCNPMEPLFQRRCARYIYVVPDGLRELMSDISREVLRCNPKYINAFIADYLDALLITRENARVACKIVDQLTECSIIVAQMLLRLNISKATAESAAKTIQKAFRKYKLRRKSEYEPFDQEELVQKLLHRSQITIDQADQAALIIQRAYRYYRAKMETHDPCRQISWRVAANRTIGIFQNLNTPKWELVRAATLIKAAYKGYYTRKLLKMLTQEQVARSTSSWRALNFKMVYMQPQFGDYKTEARPVSPINYDAIMLQIQENAAIVIQQAYRAYLVRKRNNLLEAEREDKMVHEFLSFMTVPSEDDDAIQFPFEKIQNTEDYPPS